MNAVTREVDTSGLVCPMPIIRTKFKLLNLKSGDVLRVFSTDPDSVADFQEFARQSGHELLDT